MHPTELIHRKSQISHSKRLGALVLEIKDLVVDVWHSPQAMQSLEGSASTKTRLDLVLDTNLLRNLRAAEASQHMDGLCSWLVSQQVEYSIGYLPGQAGAAGKSGGHWTTVRIFSLPR